MLTTEVEKGTEVILKNGWDATILCGQKRQATRLAEVRGFVKETGSIYATDIAKARVNGEWVKVTPTPKQLEAVRMRAAAGF
jgi:hypothetical protein